MLLLGRAFRAEWVSTLVHAEAARRPTVAEAHGDNLNQSRACAAHGCDHQACTETLIIARPNVRAKRATTAWRAGQQAQNGLQAQRLMASVTCRWRSA